MLQQCVLVICYIFYLGKAFLKKKCECCRWQLGAASCSQGIHLYYKSSQGFFYIKSDEERNMAFGDRLIGAGPKSSVGFPE